LFVEPHVLRARFAAALSAMYGREVPAYTTLVAVAHEVNAAVAAAAGPAAERFGSLERVTAERHGAIRLGTPRELAQAARIFGAMGMHPVGFYDLRDAAPNPVPVVSTAFRPVDPDELARNPFRVFTSVLATSDRRFFDARLQRRLETFLAARELFGPELLALADRAEEGGGLAAADAERFVALATAAFELSREPVDGPWYRELEAVSSVAADIGGVASTHVNHLTPRVLDIDALYARMQERGIAMIDAIQGPPRWAGPDLLLRQTSFRALDEPRAFREADGTIAHASLRVRFGEVEARGLALTPAGRDRYDALIGRPAAAWDASLPQTEHGLAAADLAYFELAPTGRRWGDRTPPASIGELLEGGWATARPIVYEDFLPRSAAGIFQSNLTGSGRHDEAQAASALGPDWMAGVLDRPLADPHDLYAAQREASLARVRRELGAPRATPARS
jgi:uncharacterized glyoxalase superfamily metalloenzyme YdcJ